MKKILSEDFAVVRSGDIRLMDHPSTIFTEDWVEVKLYKAKDKAIEEIKKIPLEVFELMIMNGEIFEPGKLYQKDGEIVLISKEGKTEKL